MSEVVEVDVVVIGTGFAGIYALHKLRDGLGLDVQSFEEAQGVGGTWFWNTYPGARSDTEVNAYCYLSDRELFEDWKWSERYPRQKEILAYLNHCADRWGLRRSIQFDTGVNKTTFNEKTGRWEITTSRGERFTSQFLVEGVGLLSSTNYPDFPGTNAFKGEIFHTARWPQSEVDISGKRVGVIGTGSSGTQVVTEMAKTAGELYVFQRTPQYCVPANHGPLNPDKMNKIFNDFDEYRDSVLSSVTSFGFEESPVPAMSVSAEERERVFEDAWRQGNGFRFMFASFSDIGVDPESNKAATDFLKKKLAETVKDPETLKKLTPTDLWAKRPLCNDGYFETFNQDNVTLVDVKEDPIIEFTEKGIRTESSEYELDVIVLATGFDAVSGMYLKIDQTGRGGVTLQQKWADRPHATYGMMAAGFPNMFMIYGPMGPFTNQPPVHEWQVDWIADVIQHVRENGYQSVEPTEDVEEKWMEACDEIAYATLFMKVNSWINGSNVVGKPVTNYFYMGGMGAYSELVGGVRTEGYPGFGFQPVLA